jgi:hypothetical protein
LKRLTKFGRSDYPLSSGNPSSLDISQAEQEQGYTEHSKNKKVEGERHDMLAINCTVENIDAIRYGQYVGERSDEYGQ